MISDSIPGFLLLFPQRTACEFQEEVFQACGPVQEVFRTERRDDRKEAPAVGTI